MNRQSLSEAEKALMEREFLHEQEYANRKRRNVTYLFVVSLVAVFVAAVTFRTPELHWISFPARMIWLVGMMGFFICLGCSTPYAHHMSNKYGTNPWMDSLRELKEPRNIIQAAVLVGAFPIFRLLVIVFREIMK